MKAISKVILPVIIAGAFLSSCDKIQTSNAVPSMSTENATGFDNTLQQAIDKLDAQMLLPMEVPVPKDAGGGYTHEKHKDNAKSIYAAGQLYEFTGDARYAEYAANLMLAYADVYADWGLHPEQKEQSPGRMFWQNLNESWWLVHAAQAYGIIKPTISEADQDIIENKLLRDVADFLSKGSPETFDKIHNHGTWATAAVGLTGYAIGDDSYVEQALMGLDKSGNTGFLKQMDVLFSPDGYYNEGPYYQRYALMPFVIFAQAVEENDPETKIFEKRDSILKKAIITTIQQSYGGLFFPINDALKDKDIATAELLHGVSIAYDLTGDTGLLSVAKAQGKFALTREGKKLADDLAAGKAKPFDYATMRLRDGAMGDQGALDILRTSSDPKGSVVVMKNTSQGLGHGHFDKLGFIFYDNEHEIISDYGAARFLNIEAKYGGHYLPENNAFAKQTIAHNALVVDQQSHFGGVTALGNQHAPELGVFVDDVNLKLASASIDTAYDGVMLKRTMAIIDDAAFEHPIAIDLMQAAGEGNHDFDLPFYYQGQFIGSNLDIVADSKSRSPLGIDNGYQYLWKTAEANLANEMSQITWLKDRKFYSVTSSVPETTKVIFAEIGANDPNFNLRREPAFIFRTENAQAVSYLSVIEPHGEYNPTVEYTLNSYSSVKALTSQEEGDLSVIRIETQDGEVVKLALSQDQSTETQHAIQHEGEELSWAGPYKLFHSKKHINQAP